MIRALFITLALITGSGLDRVALAQPVRIEHDGLGLRGELMLAEGKSLSDGLVLLLHGTLAHHRMELMAAMQSLLHERGRNSLAVSLSLGISDRQGMYDCASEHRHRHTDAIGELAAWVAWLKSNGAGPVTVLGHSRGGNQAARYGIQHARDIAALVLLAPATHEAAGDAAAYAARNGEALEARLAQAHSAAADAMLNAMPFLYCGPSQVRADSFLSYHAPDPDQDTPSLLPRITLPTLVIAGSADTTVPDVPGRMAAIEAATSSLLVIEGADHFFRDLFADDVADAMDAFIQDHVP